MKIYHICLLLLVYILILNGCAVNPATVQNDQMSKSVTIQQEIRSGKILYDQALRQLEETHPEAYVLYGEARVAELQGDLDVAIEIYHKAMQQVPENGLLLTDLGMAYLRKEDMVPARRYLLKAVSTDPNYYKSRLGLGYIYLQTQQLQKAVAQLEASLQLLQTLEGTFLLGEAEEAQGNFLRARKHYQAVIAADSKSKLGKTAASRLRSLSK